MAGMISGFMAGAADQGAKLYGAQSLDEMRAEAEIEKSRRIEEARRALNLQAGQDIDARASGAVTSVRAQAIQDKFGGQTAAEFDAPGGSLPEERALVEPTRMTKLQAKADYAEGRGYFDQAKEIRSQIQTEVQNQRFASQDKNQEERNRLIDEHNIRRDEQTAKYQTEMLKNNADKIQSMLENGSLKTQLGWALADKKLPEDQKLAINAFWTETNNITKDTTLSPEERSKALGGIYANFNERIPTQILQGPDGNVLVRDFLGAVKSYDSKEAAAQALGYGKPKAAAQPQPSPLRGALDSAPAGTGANNTFNAAPEYSPPAHSYAGMVFAKRRAVIAEGEDANAQKRAAAQSIVARALQTQDAADAAAAQDSPGFSLLSPADQQKIFKLVHGR